MKFKVSSLTHHPKNKEIYILSSIDELMESISEVGLLQSIIIDQHQQIISGNRRFESIKRLGWKPKIKLNKGLTQTINWYKKNIKKN